MAKQEETFTKIPNIILDDTTLSVYERAILIHIVRQTIGYGKKSDGISLSQFVKATGVGVTKVKETLKGLSDKKWIKLVQQTANNGGKSYNRYSLTLSRVATKHSRETANPMSCGDQPLSRETTIQKKIEQKKIDKRRETEIIDNIFFTLSDHQRKREVNSFAEYISMNASNPEAYKVKIKKQIAKEHPETLEAFQDWHFTKTCQELNDKYVDQSIGSYKIDSIYPHTHTKGYANSIDYEAAHLYYVQASNSKGETKTWGADSSKDMDQLLMSMTMDVIE